MRAHATDARKLAARVSYACALLVGVWVLERTALAAFGGREKLMFFEPNEAHRFTAMAMLQGTLKLRGALSEMWHDEQVWNGAVYTNWGFGVPLLQLPFHAVASKMRAFPQKFFPDRAIYFTYLAVAVPVLWAAFDRLVATCAPAGTSRLRRHALSWAATLVSLTCALYPPMASRFLVYEETVCYFVLFELLAVAAYVFALRSWDSRAAFALGFAAALGLLIRPIGLLYMVLWGGLVLVEGRSSRSWKPVTAFAAGAAPLVAFWMFTNWARSGSPIGLGSANSLPWYGYHTAILRFGDGCSDTLGHLGEAAARLFRGLFVTTSGEASPWMRQCHFDFEAQPVPRGTPVTSHDPLLGMGVLVLVGWMLLHLVGMRERRLAIYAPFVFLLVLFGAYAASIAGFAWRYGFDFWPAIVLACIQYVRALPAGGRRLLGWPLAWAFATVSAITYEGSIEPSHPTIELLEGSREATMLETFHKAHSTHDPLLPSSLACAARPTAPFHNGLGWNPDCSVDTFTNVDLGVLPKGGDSYDLWLSTRGIEAETLRVYANGRYYWAHREGTAYHAKLDVPYARLASPVIMVTIQWTRGFEPPPVKLLSIELT